MGNEVGYKKPPMDKRFGQPGGNPIGSTSESERLKISNAEKALKLRAMGLDALLAALEEAGDDVTTMGAILEPNALRMLKDAEDRGLGAPVQPIVSPDESMRPTTINLIAPTNDALPNDKPD